MIFFRVFVSILQTHQKLMFCPQHRAFYSEYTLLLAQEPIYNILKFLFGTIGDYFIETVVVTQYFLVFIKINVL